MATEKDQEFVEYVAKQLVDKPEAVKTERSVDEMGVLIELTVDKDDMGVIIGKEGKTAKAVRTLLRVLGAKNDARVNLKIVEPEGSEHVAKPKENDVKEEKADKQEEKPEEVAEEPKDDAKASEEPVAEDDEEDRPMADLEL